MSGDEDRIPVVVAVGQTIERNEIVTTGELCERAARAALGEAPGLAARVQRVTMVSAVFSPSSPLGATELGGSLGLPAGVRETTTVGGNTPQWLVTRAAEEIARGELSVTLIAGAESTRSVRAEGGGAQLFNQAGDVEGGQDPVVGTLANGLLSPAELAIRLYQPAQLYPLFESALAARDGRTPEQQRSHLGRMLSAFTVAAAEHRYAWFPVAVPAEELALPSPSNRVTAEPYTKRMNAFPNVDLGAALIVCSLAEARRAGAADGVAFIWSGADAADVFSPTARPDLATSPGIRAAGAGALSAAGIGIDDVDLVDLYSCFPSAVQVGAEALGMGVHDLRGLTVTGGHPYFGGPGNNYTSHSIATMVELLRRRPGLALATGLGGFITKHAVGIYGSAPPPGGFRRGETSVDQRAIDAAARPVAVEDADGAATVRAATVVYDADGAVASAPVIADLDDGRRVAALAEPDELVPLTGQSIVGARIHVSGSPATYRVEHAPVTTGR